MIRPVPVGRNQYTSPWWTDGDLRHHASRVRRPCGITLSRQWKSHPVIRRENCPAWVPSCGGPLHTGQALLPCQLQRSRLAHTGLYPIHRETVQQVSWRNPWRTGWLPAAGKMAVFPAVRGLPGPLSVVHPPGARGFHENLLFSCRISSR